LSIRAREAGIHRDNFSELLDTGVTADNRTAQSLEPGRNCLQAELPGALLSLGHIQAGFTFIVPWFNFPPLLVATGPSGARQAQAT